MPFDYTVLDNTVYLCEPVALRRAIARVAAHDRCPSPRAVARARKREIARAASVPRLASTGRDVPETETAAKTAIRAVKNKVGIIPVYGPLDQRMTPELDKAGGTSYSFISAAFDALMADSSVDAIVLDVDSPGGYSAGLPEVADKIYAARGQKALYACANAMACSAAYWLATSCQTLCVTPSGDVGSVGVYAAHVDQSRALEEDGLTITLVQAGRYKTEFADCRPLSDEAQAYLQERVNADYDKFLAALSRNRGIAKADVKANFGQGRVVGAEQALAAGMVDRVMSMEDLLRRLTGGGGASTGGGGRNASATAPANTAAVEVLRLRQQHRERQAETLRGE